MENNGKDEYATSAVMLDGEISKYVDILQVGAQRCMLSPTLFTLFTVYISDMIVVGSHGGEGVRQH